MDKQVISNSQGVCILTMFLIGTSIVLGVSKNAKQDAWISIALGILISLPMVFVYSKLLNNFPGKDLYDIFQYVLGKKLGKAISVLFIWYVFHLGALVIRVFSEFVNVVSFPETPQFIFAIFLGLLCIWIVKSGIEVLGRFSMFFLPLLMVITLIIVPLLYTNAHFINLKPILYNDTKQVLLGAFSSFSFPFTQSVIFTTVFHSLRNKKKIFKVFLTGLLISGTYLLLSSINNIIVLGVQTTTDLYFPPYTSTRTIKIGDFIERFEIVIALIFIFMGFVKVSVCLYAASTGIAKVFNINNYEIMAAPIGLLMINLSQILYNNTMEMFHWANNIYMYYAVPFQVILPIVTLIIAQIKLGSNNSAPKTLK
ncbi:endospore germination permease [Clostridium sp. AWRP]|uniref:GerAB/ArcD/ProY family transporter n=1 Tax=Clostridium sp. AWRP TaxID=2212991 RepID=UPI000FD8B65A|nr:endospore germination permease [Clostridium sp. AWRP]AZV57625.1 spore gernimation protein [Clostridium sp. AWRP]